MKIKQYIKMYSGFQIVRIFQSIVYDVILWMRPLNMFNISFPKLHLKDKKRFEKANQYLDPGLNLEEFIAFEHPEEVDYMTVRKKNSKGIIE